MTVLDKFIAFASALPADQRESVEEAACYLDGIAVGRVRLPAGRHEEVLLIGSRPVIFCSAISDQDEIRRPRCPIRTARGRPATPV